MIVSTVHRTVARAGIPTALLKQAVEKTLSGLKYKNGEVSVHLVGETEMQTLNRVHRGFDRPTDVLSFSALEGERVGPDNPDIGDIFLCIPYIRAQAKRVGVQYREECIRMLIHGVLHALGYDHGNKRDAAEMFGLQEKFLTQVI